MSLRRRFSHSLWTWKNYFFGFLTVVVGHALKSSEWLRNDLEAERAAKGGHVSGRWWCNIFKKMYRARENGSPGVVGCQFICQRGLHNCIINLHIFPGHGCCSTAPARSSVYTNEFGIEPGISVLYVEKCSDTDVFLKNHFLNFLNVVSFPGERNDPRIAQVYGIRTVVELYNELVWPILLILLEKACMNLLYSRNCVVFVIQWVSRYIYLTIKAFWGIVVPEADTIRAGRRLQWTQEGRATSRTFELSFLTDDAWHTLQNFCSTVFTSSK